MPNDHEALAATLQLLLGDVNDDEKRALFYKAFPNSFVLLKGDTKRLDDWMCETRSYLQRIYDMADGSSPLGMLAVQQVRHNADFAIRDLSKVAHVLGLKIGNMP